MKVKTAIFVVILFVLLLATLTCPNKEAHVDAIKSAVTGYVDDSMKDNDDTSGVMTFLGTLFVGKLTDMFLDSKLEVKNYLVFSVGQISIKDTVRTISVGAFNHVFTYDKDDIKSTLKKAYEE